MTANVASFHSEHFSRGNMSASGYPFMIHDRLLVNSSSALSVSDPPAIVAMNDPMFDFSQVLYSNESRSRRTTLAMLSVTVEVANATPAEHSQSAAAESSLMRTGVWLARYSNIRLGIT